MKKTIFILLAAALAASPLHGQESRKQNLMDHVFFMAADSLHGRAAGSEEAFEVADYLVCRMKEIGITPFFKDAGWLQSFMTLGDRYRNVVGVIEGSDPVLKKDYIVLGAHYDHLGIKRGKIYNGADDNASGCACVLETARTLYEHRDQLKRSVVIVFFDAEELGLYGSNAFAKDFIGSVGISHVTMMISADMVGWYKASGYLELEGVATISNTGNKIFKEEGEKRGINLRLTPFETSVFTATDTEGFAMKGVPTLAITTGLKSPYHKPEDDAELIDYDGLDLVTDYVTGIVERASQDAKFGASGKLAKKHQTRPAKVEYGFIAGIGNGRVSFPDAKVDARSRFDFAGGVTGKLNFGQHIGLQTQCLFETAGSRFPNMSNLSDSYIYRQQSLTVPFSLVVQTKEGAGCVSAQIGGFYRYAFSHSISGNAPMMTINPNQWGITAGASVRIGSFLMSLDTRWQLNKMLDGPNDPSARLRTTTFSVGYVF